MLVDGLSDVYVHRGFMGLISTGRGVIPLIGLIVLGVSGIVLTQVSFQVGQLAATLPANTAADPFAAVLIGALLLREHIPLSIAHLFGYALCLAVVTLGAIRLARNTVAGSVEHAAPQPVDGLTE